MDIEELIKERILMEMSSRNLTVKKLAEDIFKKVVYGKPTSAMSFISYARAGCVPRSCTLDRRLSRLRELYRLSTLLNYFDIKEEDKLILSIKEGHQDFIYPPDEQSFRKSEEEFLEQSANKDKSSKLEYKISFLRYPL